ncbi:cAMP-responsive element modulator-like [Phyllostomus discolor]|uniref:cAMP-responsive element modulator n=1 Tax=Phyllostomus discolor TaxID=89673 RepID=A0A7E6CM17_9CHIR|nr:cAMP-responsive element modulator-like [Phyllostomus discolor]
MYAHPCAWEVATIAETDESAESEGVIDFHKHREILSRRPSYRKVLNELSSDVPGVPKIEEEKSEEEGTPPHITTMAVPASIYQTSTGQYSMYAAIRYHRVPALRLLSLYGSNWGFALNCSILNHNT